MIEKQPTEIDVMVDLPRVIGGETVWGYKLDLPYFKLWIEALKNKFACLKLTNAEIAEKIGMKYERLGNLLAGQAMRIRSQELAAIKRLVKDLDKRVKIESNQLVEMEAVLAIKRELRAEFFLSADLVDTYFSDFDCGLDHADAVRLCLYEGRKLGDIVGDEIPFDKSSLNQLVRYIKLRAGMTRVDITNELGWPKSRLDYLMSHPRSKIMKGPDILNLWKLAVSSELIEQSEVLDAKVTKKKPRTYAELTGQLNTDYGVRGKELKRLLAEMEGTKREVLEKLIELLEAPKTRYEFGKVSLDNGNFGQLIEAMQTDFNITIIDITRRLGWKNGRINYLINKSKEITNEEIEELMGLWFDLSTQD